MITKEEKRSSWVHRKVINQTIFLCKMDVTFWKMTELVKKFSGESLCKSSSIIIIVVELVSNEEETWFFV